MSDQYHRGTAPRRTPLYDGEYHDYYDRYDDGRTAPPPPHRGGEYYAGDQYNYNRNGYTDYDPSALQIVPSYWPPHPRPRPRRRGECYVDDEADEYYYYSLNQPPPRRRAEFSDGRQRYRDEYDGYSYHPIQTISSYSHPSRPRSPPPPLRDVVSVEVARGLQRIMPSLVEVGIAKFQQMAISMRREVQTPEVRVTVETINRQAENEQAQLRQGNNQEINREEEGDETDERVNVNADPLARLRNSNRDGAETNESIN